jgi:selenide, water dikinase
MGPGDLSRVLAPLPVEDDPRILVGRESFDDAGVFLVADGLALVQTVDFFAPVVDDPFAFGRIAAANALSDVYAMGGEPLTAMNLVGFPGNLDLGILREILAGGQSKISESGARLCGGHSVQDDEPKYGLSVTGFVEENRVVRNVGARPGDALVLTKPLGVGILTTALKRDLVSEAEIEDAVEMAATLNKGGCAALREVEVSAATDVTGYGFLGHLSEMLGDSGLGAVVHRERVPVWERALSLAAEGCYPGGLKNNREYFGGRVTPDNVGPEGLLPLYDPQTSGGLLVAVPGERATAFARALQDNDTPAAVVGEVVEGGTITVVP